MRVKVTKLILPLLLVLILCSAPLAVFAAGSEAGSHADEQAVSDVTHESSVSADTHAQPDTHGAVAEHGTEAGHGAEGAHGGKSITSTKLKDLFWRTVNFIALLIILMKWVVPFITKGLAGRHQQVIEELKDLEAKRDAAERSYKEFESRLAGMEKEMEVIVERAIAQAETEKTKILADAERAAEDIKRQAEASINAQIVEAKRSLQDDIADQAAAMAEELIVKNLTPEDQVKITEQYLDRVGAV